MDSKLVKDDIKDDILKECLNLCKINNSDFVVNMEAGLGDISSETSDYDVRGIKGANMYIHYLEKTIRVF